MCFMKQPSIMPYHRGTWHTICRTEQSQPCPLACVSRDSPNGIGGRQLIGGDIVSREWKHYYG